MGLVSLGRICHFHKSLSLIQRPYKLTTLLPGQIANNLCQPTITRTASTPTTTTTARTRGSQPQLNLNRKIYKFSDLIATPKMPSSDEIIWPKICLFGDSITRRSMDVNNGCWGSMIAYKSNDLFDVHVRGFEGYNTRMALELMPKLFPKTYLELTEIMVIFFGHNDEWELGPLHVPVDEYKTNLNGIVKYLAENGLASQKIILITPSWYHKPDFDVYIKEAGFPPTTKGLEACQKYSEAVKEVGRDNSIEVLDFFTVTVNHKPLNELFCDGVHFSRKGAELLFNKLMPVIEAKVQTNYGKPLKDIKNVTPCELRPEVLAAIIEYRKTLGQTQGKQ
uniref:Isoamyl acetate-hydrolyzing esterase 1 n=1 Tax=Aceria tosichella TaxID=561515 RepID=A0A6G1S500_9ACAR